MQLTGVELTKNNKYLYEAYKTIRTICKRRQI